MGYDFFKNILIPFCKENEYRIRNYSGRYHANDCIGIVIPNRETFSFIGSLVEYTNNEGLDPETDGPVAFEILSDFISGFETDSMGRDEMIIYNRRYNFAEHFETASEEDS